jgi:hypothetical protein
MHKLAPLLTLAVGCSSPPDASPPKFDGTDAQGSVRRLTVGLSEVEVNRFRTDCMIASTGDANLDEADKVVETLPGHVNDAFMRLNGMTYEQIRALADEIRAKRE